MRTSVTYDAGFVSLEEPAAVRRDPQTQRLSERMQLVEWQALDRDPLRRAGAAGPWASRAPDVRG